MKTQMKRKVRKREREKEKRGGRREGTEGDGKPPEEQNKQI